MRNLVKKTGSAWRNLAATAGVTALALLAIGTLTAPRLQAQSGPFLPGANGVGYPACVYCPQPQYTEQALKANYEGAVVLQVIIQPSGHASNIKVVKAGPPGLGLEGKAIEAVKTWRFKPAVGPNGRIVATITPVEVTFRLPGRKPSAGIGSGY
jgi:TonB family protein